MSDQWSSVLGPTSHKLPAMIAAMDRAGLAVPPEVLAQAQAALGLAKRPQDRRLVDHEAKVAKAAVTAVLAGKSFDFMGAYARDLPAPAPNLADSHKQAVGLVMGELHRQRWPELRRLVAEAFVDAVDAVAEHLDLLPVIEATADRLDLPADRVQAARADVDHLQATVALLGDALRVDRPNDTRAAAGARILGPQRESVLPAPSGDALEDVRAALTAVSAGPRWSAHELLDELAPVGITGAPASGWRDERISA